MSRFRKTSMIFLAAALLAAPAGPGLSSFTRVAHAAEDTELQKQMEVIEDGMKKLRRSLKKAEDNAQSLETIGKMQAAAIACKTEVPPAAAKVPEADRAKFLAGYRKGMVALVAEMCQMEIALLDGDNAKAEELFKGLKKIEDDGHEKYSEE